MTGTYYDDIIFLRINEHLASHIPKHNKHVFVCVNVTEHKTQPVFSIKSHNTSKTMHTSISLISAIKHYLGWYRDVSGMVAVGWNSNCPISGRLDTLYPRIPNEEGFPLYSLVPVLLSVRICAARANFLAPRNLLTHLTHWGYALHASQNANLDQFCSSLRRYRRHLHRHITHLTHLVAALPRCVLCHPAQASQAPPNGKTKPHGWLMKRELSH